MAIDITMRGILEQYIDSIVIAIPNIVQVFFNRSNKAQLQIQNENDFVLGVALGNIQNAFLTTFVSLQARYPNPEELEEISNVIYKRIPEIRDAMFNAR
jgi:urate oxidase